MNARENIPGVTTRLGASVWLDLVEQGLREAFAALGVISRAEVGGYQPDERVTRAFYGRFVVNVDSFRLLLDLTPGASGRVFEESLFSSARDLPVAKLAPWRYPLFAFRGPVIVALLPRRTRAQTVAVRAWWRDMTSQVRPRRDAATRLAEAFDRATRVMRGQLLTTMVAQGLLEQLGRLASRSGVPDAHLSLMTGYGNTDEVQMVATLYRLAHEETTLEEFLATYGARCPGENELSAHSWREDSSLVAILAQKYRSASGIADPVTREARREAERANAEQRVLGGLHAIHRPAARALFRLGKVFIPLREENKGSLAMTVDAARAAARDLGRELAAAGTIDDPEDVFYLTRQELCAGLPSDPRKVVSERRSLRGKYEGLDLPPSWTGEPVPITISGEDRRDQRASEVDGVPAAAGIAEGRARVILDATGIDDLEPDEILVCRTTDPSWASAFHLVAATVIDIGGPISHGAIVSREMGIPCVINTQHGTRVLRTGDLLRVDGTAGRVTVLEPAP